MATIGLIDWDLTHYKQPITFNLELMKLATHHKQKRNIIKMLSEFDPIRYSKIIIRKDYEDEYYPASIFNNDKVQSGGLVFSNGQYKPMDLKIEKMVADTSIYLNMKYIYEFDQSTRYRFNSMIKSPHLRFSLNGNTVWEDWESQLAGCVPGSTYNWIIHDKEPNKIIGIIDEINRVLPNYNSQGRRLGFKHSLYIKTDKEFQQWGAQRKLKHMSNMILFKIFDDMLFKEAIDTGGHMECQYVLKQDHLTDATLCQIYLQTIFLREHYSKILLTIEDQNLVSPEQNKIFQLINEYSAYCYKTHKQVTMYDWARRWCRWLKVDIINIFEYIRTTNYPLFKLFYECLTVEINNNKFESRFIWKANGGNI